jgi:predicted RNase H-like HicB family nuclease
MRILFDQGTPASFGARLAARCVSAAAAARRSHEGVARRIPAMKFSIECEREEDGRWIAELLQLPGVLAYGASREAAIAKAEALALRVIADQIEHGERPAL